jgi:NAD-dependent DNA ligase
MNEKIVQEILDELFSSLEALETRSAAVLQFLKDKGIAKAEELAPYLEQAGNASSVRWLAARVRIEHLLAGAMKSAEDTTKESPKVTGTVAEESQEAKRSANKSDQATFENKATSAQDAAPAGKTPEGEAAAPVGTKENEEKINQEKKKDEENAEAGRNTNTDDAKNAA